MRDGYASERRPSDASPPFPPKDSTMGLPDDSPIPAARRAPNGHAPNGPAQDGGTPGGGARPVRLGLRENRLQFTLLVLATLAVGGLVGLERTTVPLIGSETFGLTSDLAVFSFIIAFGLTKALTNLAAGALTARFTRRSLLLTGWLIGVPVPFALAWAPSWGWIVAANVLLGLNQGLTWSMAVNMKIDLVGPARRGLATGLNEAAGYTAVGVTALLTGYLATAYGLRPVPELIGAVFLVTGLALSLAVRDTAAHVALELARHAPPLPTGEDTGLKAVFARTSWRDRSLRGASQAGLVNNLNDGLTWGVFPLLFTEHGLGLAAVGLIKGLYPILWGLGQIPTGHLADRLGRKPLVVTGMLVQAGGLLLALVLLDRPLLAGILSAVALGLGTALVYPALIASVSDHAHPAWRAHALGTYRFWRDIGYATGALVAGILADALGLESTVLAAAVLTALSGLLAARWMTDRTAPGTPPAATGARPKEPAART
ncbi:MFS transporter [Streptomyces termitum]|uniref:MFS transporter n=2 Tax=Streptomyces termitum TaxID=67368 RepID=A0A918WBQ3_9ACTN|nr:MFS transporter [Streptomyces termitum]